MAIRVPRRGYTKPVAKAVQTDLPSDFDAAVYRELYKDLANMNNQDCAKHYLKHGKAERRVYRLPDLPSDFDWKIYTTIHADLRKLTETEAKHHYATFGQKENRTYNLSNVPSDFVWEDYLRLNPDIPANTEVEAKMHYNQYGFYENRLVKKRACMPTVVSPIYRYCNGPYSGNYPVLRDIGQLPDGAICVYILGSFRLDDAQILLLASSLVGADVVSPTIVDVGKKLVYYGGLVLNNVVSWINEDLLPYDALFSRRNEYCRNTDLLFPGAFATRSHALLRNYDSAQAVMMHLDDTKDIVTKVTPFSVFTLEKPLDSKYLPRTIQSFTFSRDFVRDWWKHPLPMKGAFPFLDSNTRPYVLVCDAEMLQPDRNCGSKYVLYFIQTLLLLRYNVHFCTENVLHNAEYAPELLKRGVAVFSGSSFRIQKHLKDHGSLYSFVFVSRSDLFSRIDPFVKQYTKAKRIFLPHELTHLRMRSEDLKESELRNVTSADLSLVVSKTEHAYLQSMNCSNIMYSPICMPSEGMGLGIEERKDIYFVGSLHQPNMDALEYFLEHLFASILKHVDLKLYVIGEVCLNYEDYLTKFPNNLVLCCTLSAYEYAERLRTMRVCLVPLLSGSGVKGKVLDALNKGIPCISTSKGMEGLDLTDKEHIVRLECEDVDYGKKFAEFYKDLPLLSLIAKQGKTLFDERYSLTQSETYCRAMFDRL